MNAILHPYRKFAVLTHERKPEDLKVKHAKEARKKDPGPGQRNTQKL